MNSELLKQLGMSQERVAAVLEKLLTKERMIRRVKDEPLLLWLENLQIIRIEKKLVYLSNLERLKSFCESIDFNQGAVVSHQSILRNLTRIHHKSAAAWRGNSKSGQSEPLLMQQTITQDYLLRMRSANTGLTISYRNGLIQSVDEETLQRTECMVSERLWLNKKSISFKQIKLVLTVENLGAFVDMPLVDGLLLIYAAGNNLPNSALVLQALPQDIPWAAFPDYDPNGLLIVKTIAEKTERPANIWLPDYWQDQAQQRSREMLGKNKRPWQAAPAISLPGLRDKNRWLEQENLVLDQRCEKALIELVENGIGKVSI